MENYEESESLKSNQLKCRFFVSQINLLTFLLRLIRSRSAPDPAA
jgi:hypothetical protein